MQIFCYVFSIFFFENIVFEILFVFFFHYLSLYYVLFGDFIYIF
jgi:hypothetical protein